MYAIRSYYVSLGDFQENINKGYCPENVLQEADKRIGHLIPFEANALYLVDQQKSDRITSYNVCYTKLLRDGRPLAYALFAHCFTCSKNIKAIAHISRALTREGIAVLRFDFTGLGESEGDFSDTNFSSNVDDLIRAAAFLKSRITSYNVCYTKLLRPDPAI